MTDYKQLHEKLISIVEKNIDPDFRKYIQQRSDEQRKIFSDNAAKYNKYAQDADEGSFWKKDYADNAKAFQAEADKKNMPIQNVYKELASYIDVQNANIIKIENKGLTSKQLRKELAKYITNEDIQGVLLVPNAQPLRNEFINSIKKQSSFDAFNITYSKEEGKIYLQPYWSVTNSRNISVDGPAVNRFMTDLNKGKYTTDLYLAYGENIRKTRVNKGRQSYLRSEEDIYGKNLRSRKYAGQGEYDKSGYVRGTEDLMKRLAQYKQEKGSYQKDVNAIYNVFDKILDEYKQNIMQYDPRKPEGRNNWEIVASKKKLDNVSYYVERLAVALEEKNGEDIQNAIENCKRVMGL